jgi:thymidylate kinase
MEDSPAVLSDCRPAARHLRRGPRILVDGLDLTGKSTLTAAIIAALGGRGVPVMPHRGMLAGHYPLERRLRRTFPLVRQPDSSLVTAVFLLGAYPLDRVLAGIDPPQPPGTVLVQDGYADRTAALGMAGGPYLAARLALRWPRIYAPFDVAVYLHAPAATRAARLAARPDADVNDVRSARDIEFAETFTAMLVQGMGRRHRQLLVFDTSRHSPEEMAADVTGLLLAGGTSATAPGLPEPVTGRAA